MPRVLVLNNYPLDEVWEEVGRKEKPDHHLYGINYFYQRGYKVEIIPFKTLKIFHKIHSALRSIHFPMPLGDLDQEWSCWDRLNHADLIYAPCQTLIFPRKSGHNEELVAA